MRSERPPYIPTPLGENFPRISSPMGSYYSSASISDVSIGDNPRVSVDVGVRLSCVRKPGWEGVWVGGHPDYDPGDVARC